MEESCVRGKNEGCLQDGRNACTGGGMQAGREVGYMQNTRDAGRARHGRVARWERERALAGAAAPPRPE